MSTDSLSDIVRALLVREGTFLRDSSGLPLEPVREAYILREIVELVEDGVLMASWDDDKTTETVVDKNLLDACRAS